MKNILAIFMALTPLVSFSMDGPKTKRVVGFMVDIIKQSDEQASAAVYGSAPQATSFMQAARFPALTRTVSEPVSRTELTRVLHDQQAVQDPTCTDDNTEFLDILFSAPAANNSSAGLTPKTQERSISSEKPKSPVLLRRNRAVSSLVALDTNSGSNS